ncbi:hypothetical protein [Stenotrophomonas sp. SORGH_AS_0321]|uniref:hypothetical protein n=1 Tax=Stenotrophomonas sp. SORGH_AS_0321 TaxID=3041787 RepID=UPI00286078BB|nr:hypothetical protein [Stenotrophomonas sp. SORGH_AS_0321]MDR6096051.1 hypothetical protein [Stenotrophomonas sp. SORGH_AS_0321]
MSEDKYLKLQMNDSGNVSLALKQLIYCLIKRLQDGQIILPARRLHNNTCAYFQRSGEEASTPFPCAPTFPSLRAAHYSRLFRFVNTFFQGRFAVAKRC